MGAELGLIDLAMPASTGADSSANVDTTAAVETPTTETTTTENTEVEAPVAGSEEAGKETATHHADGREKSEEERTAYAEKQDGITEKTPSEIRKSLKALRDLDPSHAAACRALHGSYERYEAIKGLVGPGGFGAVKSQVDFLREIAGNTDATKPLNLAEVREKYNSVAQTVEMAKAYDAKLYAGDGTLIDDVVSDLKAQGEGVLDKALPKLTSKMLSSLQKESPAGFARVALPFMVSQLREAGFTGAVNDLYRLATASGDKNIIAKTKALGEWFNELQNGIQTQEQEEERQEEQGWRQEKAQHETQQQQEVKNAIARTADSFNNKELGKRLGVYLKTPFFKGFGRENLMPLGNGIKAELYSTLKADKNYQDQMRAMMAAAKPDDKKIQELHRATVQVLAEGVVRRVVQRMYPTASTGGAAAGRIAAKAAATSAAAGTGSTVTKAQLEAPGGPKLPKPIYVAQKPKNLDRTIKGWEIMEINGKGLVPNGKGGWSHVTWRKI
jgi:hypothetical protein